VSKSRICKRATSHTFRHSFTRHLLQAGYDIHTIQELLGDGDVRTTMMYAHTVKSLTAKDAKTHLVSGEKVPVIIGALMSPHLNYSVKNFQIVHIQDPGYSRVKKSDTLFPGFLFPDF